MRCTLQSFLVLYLKCMRFQRSPLSNDLIILFKDTRQRKTVKNLTTLHKPLHLFVFFRCTYMKFDQTSLRSNRDTSV